MLVHPDFNPVAIDIGFIKIYWYSLMYLCGFAYTYIMFRSFVKTGRTRMTYDQAEYAILLGALCIVLGGRIGYVFFYGMDTLLKNPLSLLQAYSGGMSFHGALIGGFIATLLFCYQTKIRFGEIGDLIAVTAPVGIFFGRMGNFIGQELWGRVTTVPWGMIFPKDVSGLVRHPSQLYEAVGEGLILFLIVYLYGKKKVQPEGSASALAITFYGVFRFVLEFFREPDTQVGYDFLGWMTRGQLLSLPMIILGGVIFIKLHNKQNHLSSCVKS